MDFNSILKLVKQQNPKMPHKEAQQKAKDMFQKMKQAQAELKNEVVTEIKPQIKAKTELKNELVLQASSEIQYEAPRPPILLPGGINVDTLYSAEESIRNAGVNRNSIIFHGHKAIPNGKLVIHSKEGANKLVTFEDEEGNCIPINGYFRIFLP